LTEIQLPKRIGQTFSKVDSMQSEHSSAAEKVARVEKNAHKRQKVTNIRDIGGLFIISAPSHATGRKGRSNVTENGSCVYSRDFEMLSG
jgi:hypothetical protein